MFKKVILNFILPITAGTIIYLLFRDKHLLVFHWADRVGVYLHILDARQLFADLAKYLPHATIYSLPNGLWAYSFVFFISYIWRDDHGVIKVFLSSWYVYCQSAVSLANLQISYREPFAKMMFYSTLSACC